MFMMKSWKLCLLALALLLGLAASPASAANLSKVRMVDYGAGAFVQTGPSTWAEVSKSDWQIAFTFDEYFRSASALKFIDRSRNVQILVDAASGQILYASGNDAYQPLYNIVGTSTKSRIPGSQVSWDGAPDAPTGLAVDGQPAQQTFDGYAWTYERTRTAIGFGIAKGSLAFASDDAAEAILLCVVNSQNTLVIADFGADVAGVSAGTGLAVEFTGEGFYTKVSAKVSTAQGKVPRGVAFSADISNPLWAAMQGRRSLTLQPSGRAATRLPLTAGSSAVAQFVQECSAATFD